MASHDIAVISIAVSLINSVATIGMFMIHCAREKREFAKMQLQIDRQGIKS